MAFSGCLGLRMARVHLQKTVTAVSTRAGLPALEQFLADAGSLKVMDFVRSRNWRRVDFEPGGSHAFFNINTLEDYEMALSLLKEQAAQP